MKLDIFKYFRGKKPQGKETGATTIVKNTYRLFLVQKVLGDMRIITSVLQLERLMY